MPGLRGEQRAGQKSKESRRQTHGGCGHDEEQGWRKLHLLAIGRHHFLPRYDPMPSQFHQASIAATTFCQSPNTSGQIVDVNGLEALLSATRQALHGQAGERTKEAGRGSVRAVHERWPHHATIDRQAGQMGIGHGFRPEVSGGAGIDAERRYLDHPGDVRALTGIEQRDGRLNVNPLEACAGGSEHANSIDDHVDTHKTWFPHTGADVPFEIDGDVVAAYRVAHAADHPVSCVGEALAQRLPDKPVGTANEYVHGRGPFVVGVRTWQRSVQSKLWRARSRRACRSKIGPSRRPRP